MRKIVAIIALVVSTIAAPALAEAPRSGAGAERAVEFQSPAVPQGVAAYGPFRVLDESRAALVEATDAVSLREFADMLQDHPGIATLELIDCPGTDDDVANLKLGRMIRARGIATHVPAGGSVRSGAVELFLAGTRRSIDDGAEFAVHAWRDSDGHEPGDYPADSPYNRAYIDFYAEMGVAQPQAFYDMTNAVPNDAARWLTAQDMRAWIGEPRDGNVTAPAPAPALTPTIAYLDLGHGIP